MAQDPRDNLDWERALVQIFEALPAVPEGQARLYRIEPKARTPKAAWLEEALAATNPGEGRWFTDDPQALLFYVRDQALAQPTLLFLDVPPTLAKAWQVKAWTATPGGEDPRRFSRDPEREYFLPDRALRPTQRWELPHVEPQSAPPMPARKPRL